MSNEVAKTAENTKVVENIEVMPPVDIVENPENYIMHFEVPGCNSASVNII